MDKLLQLLDKIIPLLPFYPAWARTLFVVSFLAAMVSIAVFVVIYPAASKRRGEASERSAIGLDVSLLDGERGSDDSTEPPDPLEVRYEMSRTSENLSISPRVGYLDLLARGGPINPDLSFHTPFHMRLPTLDVKVVNNGTETLFFSGAVFEVEESAPDAEPVLFIAGDALGTSAATVRLRNDGWGDVVKPVLRFNVAASQDKDWSREGNFAKPPVGMPTPPFTNELQGETFSDSSDLDISRALDRAGANLEWLDVHLHVSREGEGFSFNGAQWLSGNPSPNEDKLRLVSEGPDGARETFTGTEYRRAFQKALGPFTDNLALVEGELEYEMEAAPPARRRVTFVTFVHLYNENRKGAPVPPSYQYDVQLRTEGSRYSVPVDVSQAIKPGEFDRFTFRVAASQSSQYRFRARFIYNGDKAVVCAPIILKYFMPRSATNRLRAAAPQAAPK